MEPKEGLLQLAAGKIPTLHTISCYKVVKTVLFRVFILKTSGEMVCLDNFSFFNGDE